MPWKHHSSLETVFGLNALETATSDLCHRPTLQRSGSSVASSSVSSNLNPQDKYNFGGDVEVPDSLSSRAIFKFMRGPFGRICVSSILLLNGLQMGAAADYKGGNWDATWQICDHFFTSVFALEMVVQLVALRQFYFYSWWNILDFVVAWVAIFNTWFLPLLEIPTTSTSTLRVFRSLRLLRLVKVMRAVPELMMVVEGLVASMKAMFWIVMLLVIVLYMASILCVEVIGEEKKAYPDWSDDSDEVMLAGLEGYNNDYYFGSVLRSMSTLFSLVLLDDWSVVFRAVFEAQRPMCLFFIGLVTLCSFGILNVIIGVVVERTTEAMKTVRDSHLETLRKKQSAEVELLANVMFDLDEDQDGRLTLEEFQKGSEHKELQEMLMGVGLPSGFTFHELFQTLDGDGSGWLSKGEFLDGMMRLIYNDQFKRDCLLSCSVGQLKASVAHFRTDLHAELRILAKDLRRDLQQFGDSHAMGRAESVSEAEHLSEQNLRRKSLIDGTQQVGHVPTLASSRGISWLDEESSTEEERQAGGASEGRRSRRRSARAEAKQASRAEARSPGAEARLKEGRHDEPAAWEQLQSSRSSLSKERELLDKSGVEIAFGHQENREGIDIDTGIFPPVDIDEAHAKFRNEWEPLQIMMMPARFAARPDASSCSVPQAEAEPPWGSAELSNQNIIGFLPIMASAPSEARDPGNGRQQVTQVQDRMRWVHLGMGQTPLGASWRENVNVGEISV